VGCLFLFPGVQSTEIHLSRIRGFVFWYLNTIFVLFLFFFSFFFFNLNHLVSYLIVIMWTNITHTQKINKNKNKKTNRPLTLFMGEKKKKKVTVNRFN
jgi:hypothetical protein